VLESISSTPEAGISDTGEPIGRFDAITSDKEPGIDWLLTSEIIDLFVVACGTRSTLEIMTLILYDVYLTLMLPRGV